MVLVTLVPGTNITATVSVDVKPEGFPLKLRCPLHPVGPIDDRKMKIAFTVVFIVMYAVTACMCENEKSSVHSRKKRNAVQLGWMIFSRTRRSALAYNGYGCRCGLGGRGTPKDGVDSCCLVHDRCYGRLTRSGCPNPVLNTYRYTLRGGIVCNSRRNDVCEQIGCECDRALAYCFARNIYNVRYRNWRGSC
ncbi:acidic phospholipase A2 PLA-1-like [Lingula anatina]|uniref:Phospholipase A2 n=1 Tax=Lingula anatina TaxID=7574 RepID=A0A1S3I8U8_LINAN|nr:acidic phospholipase A2 PLA-1-like [Lingula anatina]|eukprot:XP_013393814.1 acidic phospholipase A2 PLA-1-like [Lingula anatina]